MDVYTRKGQFSILDLDSNNGVTLITFDAKRQKWVAMEASSDGWGVAEGVANAGDPNKMTFFGAYPHVGKRPFVVNQISHSHFTLGIHELYEGLGTASTRGVWTSYG